MDIYEIGKSFRTNIKSESIDKKLKLVLFPYDSEAVINSTLLIFATALVFYVFADFLFGGTDITNAVPTIILFLGIIAAAFTFVYPTGVFYGKRMSEYNEEMLRAIMRLSTYISMDSSMEYAFFETQDHLYGTLREQFIDINNNLRRKSKVNIGDAMAKYTKVWNSVNPVFVKSLRLLQTASMSPKKDRDTIIKETIETLMINFQTQGKRSAEELAANSSKLISGGVLLPIMSLMLLPLVTVFMPDVARADLLLFAYVVLIPTLTLLISFNFSAKRIQIDTIRIEESERFKPMPKWIKIVSISVAILFMIPALMNLNELGSKKLFDKEISMQSNDEFDSMEPVEYLKFKVFSKESYFHFILIAWLPSLGIMLGLWFYAYLYTKRYEKLWGEVFEIEEDLPHLLQSFSTYLTLNMSVENIVGEVVDDYKRFGFGKHPVVKMFKELKHKLYVTKNKIEDIVKHTLPKICPSMKVSNLLNQIISFTNISQKAATKAAKMVRTQTVALYKLDDYMKTLLSETASLISTTASVLAPLLCAAAVIMSVAIVKSLKFITAQMESILGALSTGGAMGSLNLIDTSQIIPPTIVEIIIGFYLIETIVILSIFGTNIKIGNDKFQIWKSIKKGVTGFIIYSTILVLGYYFMVDVLFKTMQ